MRLILIGLALLLALIQYPLWLGKGGWLRVWNLDQQVIAAQKKNDDLRSRNAKLNSEVMDLKQGTGAVEERARYELGMIKESEIFIQIVKPADAKPALPNDSADSRNDSHAAPAVSTKPATPEQRSAVSPKSR